MNEQSLANRKRCLKCKFYSMNVCPILCNADVFEIDNCILTNERILNLNEEKDKAEWFMFCSSPTLYLRYLNYCRKDKLPKLGAKVVTLRPGFSGPAGVIRKISEITTDYFILINGDGQKSISYISNWYDDFFEI